MLSTQKDESPEFEAYLRQQANKSFLRFITCGSVDDGKSTLIGRLLYDSRLIFEDQLAALKADSKKSGTQGEDIDFALLVDGLAAEREQGITIDVAYRFFTTDKRKFIVADTPGHEQYTRNMATGASTADVAILLVDARKGVLTQTRRHSFITSMFGIKHILVAVNKMDLVDFAEATFNTVEQEYRKFARELNFNAVTVVPVSALAGDNIMDTSSCMPWYKGQTILDYLETVEVDSSRQDKPFRMSVQWVNRPNLDFRGYSGTIAAGTICPGDTISILPSGKSSVVERIVTFDGDLEVATVGQAVTITLKDEIDISRGDVLSSTNNPVQVSDQLQARILWMHDHGLIQGRQYYLKSGSRLVLCQVTNLKHKINVNTLEIQPGKTLELNEIGVANLSLMDRIAFDSFADCQGTGNFILLDRQTNDTVGVGLFDFSLRRADNVVWQALTVNKFNRGAIKGQKPCVVWMTGLSGSGKSTVANMLESKLHDLHRHTYILDGDNVRHGLNRDLGFVEADRVENIRRVGEISKLMVDCGLITIVSFISPYLSERKMVRELLEPGEFIEVFIDTPIEVCEQRDPKGLYKKARSGEIKNFTGIDSIYEAPVSPDIRLDTTSLSAQESVEVLVEYLQERGFLASPEI